MSCLSLTVGSIKTGINLLRAAMIEPAKFGIHNQAICFILWRDIKMLSTPWPSMSLLGIYSVLCRDRIATGSFDKTAKLWDTETGNCLYTFAGHQN